jgi:hypothetical protein
VLRRKCGELGYGWSTVLVVLVWRARGAEAVSALKISVGRLHGPVGAKAIY